MQKNRSGKKIVPVVLISLASWLENSKTRRKEDRWSYNY